MEKKHHDTSKKILHEGKFIRFVDRGGWEYVERSNCSGIVIIISQTEDNKIIFVEQYRPPVDRHVIEFPAGLVNDHGRSDVESIETAAIRELYEETGYQAEGIELLTQGPVSGGSSADLVAMVRAFGLKKTGTGGGDGTEEITVHEVDFDHVDSWLKEQEKRGVLIEPKIFSGLYFLKNET